MKKFFILILFMKFFKISNVIVPLWNFDLSAKDLFSNQDSYEYTICIQSYGINPTFTVTLTKKISKNKGNIIEQNILKINDGYEKETEWEDIESIYTYNDILYICPKGKYHLNKYLGSEGFTEIIPDKFDYSEDWELKCYKQTVKNYLFVAYLNKYNKIFAFIFEDKSWHKTSIDIYDGLFDFKWTEEAINNREYPMKLIMLNIPEIKLETRLVTLEKENNLINSNPIYSTNLAKSLKYSNAYFDSNNDFFYFITFNLSPFSFISGYYNAKTSFNYNEVENLSPIITNSVSPFQFYNDFIIKRINLTRNTQYVLYEIYDTIKNKSYYGIVDILENKIIFNTDEPIISFTRLKQDSESGYSFLAITKESAYRICALADNNKNCISSCSSGSVFINSQGQNFCGDKCPNYIMYPTGICVDECDLNIFYLADSYKCGFCKDVNPNYPYKLLNSSECLKEKPEGTYLFKPEFKILDNCHTSCKNCTGPSDTQCEICKDGYSKIGDKCTPSSDQCHEKCLFCIEQPENDYKQNCLSCKDNFLLQKDKGNCVEECKNGYFQEDKYCKKCEDPCETCNNLTQCITCINGFYFNDTENICNKCDSNCEICVYRKENGNEHCSKCISNKFLINETETGGNCVDECPEGTIGKDGKCVKKEKANKNYMLYIFIIIVAFLLLLITVNNIKKCFMQKRHNYQSNEISLELKTERD